MHKTITNLTQIKRNTIKKPDPESKVKIIAGKHFNGRYFTSY